MLLRRMITRSVLLLSLASAAVAVAVWPSGISAAGAESGWLTVPGGFPLFDLAGIVPGGAGSATITVTNPQAFPVTFSIAITALDNDDNGCNEPEEAIGDTTCGPGGGELQFDLRLAMTASGQTDTPIADRTIAEWATQPAIDPIALGGHEARTYRVGYKLPIGTTNVTQSDLVAFQLELRLDQELESIVSMGTPPMLIAATPTLPRTGIDVRVVLTIGLSAGIAGLALYRLSTPRRRSS